MTHARAAIITARSRLSSCRKAVKRAVATTLVATTAAATLSACSDTDTEALTVFATTGYIADAVENILPEAEITTMVGPGGDPHTYQPSTKDIEEIQDSDLVLWNGLHLEAQMVDQLSSLGDKQLAVGDKLPEDMLLPWPEKDDAGQPLFDPHVWNSPTAWSMVIGFIVDKISEIAPEHAEEARRNGEKYQERIEGMAEESSRKMDAVKEPRILVTGHDAFNYFGKTFGLEVHATDFVSTEAQKSAAEISELADLIAEHKIPVIFQDNQANPQAITSLKEAVRSRGWEVEVSDEELYADSLGAEEGVDTYIGAFEHNVDAVAKELS